MTDDDLLSSDEALALLEICLHSRTPDILEQLRERVCCYRGQRTCDCKYSDVGSTGRPLGSDEATGCPELREAIKALRALPGVLARLRAAEADRDVARNALSSCLGFLVGLTLVRAELEAADEMRTPGRWVAVRGAEGYDLSSESGPITIDSGARARDMFFAAVCSAQVPALLAHLRAAEGVLDE